MQTQRHASLFSHRHKHLWYKNKNKSQPVTSPIRTQQQLCNKTFSIASQNCPDNCNLIWFMKVYDGVQWTHRSPLPGLHMYDTWTPYSSLLKHTSDTGSWSTQVLFTAQCVIPGPARHLSPCFYVRYFNNLEGLPSLVINHRRNERVSDEPLLLFSWKVTVTNHTHWC